LSLRAEAKSLEGNPIIGYRVNETLSVAAGLHAILVQTGFSRAILPSVQNPSVAELDVSDVALGWNWGATLTPWSGTDLALGYRSAINVSYDTPTQSVDNPRRGLQLHHGQGCADQRGEGASRFC
jgi:long-chain fatty acid transport protein